jgi:toxin ParE1/3/4
MARVVWTSPALRSIWQVSDYLVDFNPTAAKQIADPLLAAGDSLEHFPHRGRLVRGTWMRELVGVNAYVIRYEIADDDVVILRVPHSARRPTQP